MADNFHFDITGAPLDKCIEIALIGAPGKKVVGWRVDIKPTRMLLFWAASDQSNPLPAPMTENSTITGFIKSWLTSAEYGPEPDHDGHNSQGWRVYNESWGHVNHEYQAFVAIEPVWLMYGK